MVSGDAAVVCGAVAATCAEAGGRPIPAKPADNKARESGIRLADRRPRPMVSGYERRFGVACIVIGQRSLKSSPGALTRGDRDGRPKSSRPGKSVPEA